MSDWSIDHEKRAVAQEIEEGKRVAVHCHLENYLPWKQLHVEELAKTAERRRMI